MNETLTYYSAVVAIVLLTQITGLVIVNQNKNLKKNKRQGFILTFALLIWATLLEWSSHTVLAINLADLVFWRKVVKCIELSIAPVILVECAFNVFSIKISKTEKLISKFVLSMHTVLEILSIPFNFIFGVTDDNVYYHSTFYWIYTTFLLIAVIFLFYKIVGFCKYYQNHNLIVLVLMVLILGIGTIVRFMNSEIRLDWLTATITVILLYVYYNDIAMHIDFLTKMLNQRSYLNELDSLSFPAIVIIFDINDFKHINDTYGHNYGDEMITLTGKLIKNVFQESGKCFRIGGDEFAVLQTKNLETTEALIEELRARLNTKRAKDPRVPYISWGFARYDNEYQQIKDIIKEADKNMYETKKRLKEKND